MGFKVAIISTGLLIAVATGSWFYIHAQGKEIATLKANAIVLKDKIE